MLLETMMKAGDGVAVNGVIVAGGESRRMGRDKAFIEFQGKPLVEHTIDALRPLCSEIIIVTNNPAPFERFRCRIIPDVLPGKGSLGGVYSGLMASTENYVVAVACDMPFLSQQLIQYMLTLAPGLDVVIPHASDPSSKIPPQELEPRRKLVENADLQPLHAVYGRSCLDTIARQLHSDDLRLKGFLDKLRVRVIEKAEIDKFDPAHLSFFNINTPDDIETALKLIRNETSKSDRDTSDV